MIKYEEQEENNQAKKSGMLFVTFALGFLAVLSSGYAVLTSFQRNEMAMRASASAMSALANSSQGISQELPPEILPTVETSSAGVLNENR